ASTRPTWPRFKPGTGASSPPARMPPRPPQCCSSPPPCSPAPPPPPPSSPPSLRRVRREPGGRMVLRRHEPGGPRQYDGQPSRDAQRRGGVAELGRSGQPDAEGGQVVAEAALVVLAEQGGPGGQPVRREVHRQRMPPQRPQPVAHPCPRPVHQAGQAVVERRRALAL